MLTLAIETSSAIGSVALLKGEDCLAEKSFGARERHSADLVPAVQKILSKAKVRAEQVDLWAVGLGPGSFMGIRVGIAAAKGFALATGQPLVGVSSFDVLAAEFVGCPPRRTTKKINSRLAESAYNCFGVITDAGRGELYFARYECLPAMAGEPHAPIRIIKPDELPAGFFLIGPTRGQHPRARFVAQLGRKKFLAQKHGDETLEPIYLRETKFVKVGEKR